MQKKIGHYELITRIGEGGTGIVYLARDIILNRDVALKLLHLNCISDSIMLTRFLREAELAAGLDHPHIVSIYGTCNNPPYIVMQYLAGGSLRDRLNRTGRIDEKKATTIALQTASALAAAHRNGIIHRDIKPENILFDALDLVKIVDFGIAKAQTNTQLTLTGEFLGTTRYMSPEQSSADPDAIGPASDIYNFGVMLYEMITGALPHNTFLSSSKQPIYSGVIISKSLKVVISRCLQPDPTRRYRNATELHAALDALSSGSKKKNLNHAIHLNGTKIPQTVHR